MRDDLRRRTTTQQGNLDRLPRVINSDRNKHGAPLPDGQERVLYPDASEDIPAEALDEVERLELSVDDFIGPPPPPPEHPRHRTERRNRDILSDASIQVSPISDTPSWSTFDIGRAMSALRPGSEASQIQILRRLHVRWFHVSPTKMMS